MEGRPASSAEVPFERALERLEEIVGCLEQGELSLEDALAAFEEGVGLCRRCAAQLDAAERRIEVLVEEGEGLVRQPLDAGADGA